MKKHFLLLSTMLLISATVYAKVSLLPISQQDSTSGWRGDNQQRSEYYNPLQKYEGVNSSFKNRELISVKPSGFCAIAAPVCYNGRMLEFSLSGHIYSKTAYEFSTQKNIKATINGKSAKALPSKSIAIAAENGLGGTVVNVLLPA